MKFTLKVFIAYMIMTHMHLGQKAKEFLCVSGIYLLIAYVGMAIIAKLYTGSYSLKGYIDPKWQEKQ